MNKLAAKIIRATLCALSVFIITFQSCESQANMLNLDEALTKAVENIGSYTEGETEIAIAGIDALMTDISGFLSDELAKHLRDDGKFILKENKPSLEFVNIGQQFQSSTFRDDESAINLGRFMSAKFIITGNFSYYTGFSQLRLRVIDVENSKVITQYTARIRQRDAVLADAMKNAPKPQKINENALAFFNRGEDFMREGKFKEAADEFSQALTASKDFFDGYYYRGLAYARVKDFNKAIEDWSFILQKRPDFYEALYSRGIAYTEIRELDKAIEDWTSALEVKPDYIRAMYNRALAYYNMRNNDKSIEDYTAALKIKPDYASVLFNRGAVYFRIGDYDKAIDDWEEVLRLAPGLNAAILNVEIARERRGY